MEQNKQTLFVIASHFLSYPLEAYADIKEDLLDYVSGQVSSETLQGELEAAFSPFFQMTLQETRELYVATFDLKSKLGLYLTAHELGDSRKRGAALIKLQKMINQAGFERNDGELADYMPMLFEFLAAAPDVKDGERLTRRLAVAVQRMHQFIYKDNPYAAILALLMTYAFETPTKEEVEQLAFDREEADLEELPYPIMY